MVFFWSGRRRAVPQRQWLADARKGMRARQERGVCVWEWSPRTLSDDAQAVTSFIILIFTQRHSRPLGKIVWPCISTYAETKAQANEDAKRERRCRFQKVATGTEEE